MADVKAMYKAAFRRFAEGQVDEAIAGYREVIELDPKFALAYQALSEAHSRKGELDAAIAAIQLAIQAEPSESLYHTSLSRFLQRQGRIPEAEAAAAVAQQLQARGS
jgi:tetratricopeptide (TPR) repeat protein